MDSSETDDTELKKRIIKLLLKGGASNLAEPVQTTILFTSDNTFVNWKGLIDKEIGIEAFYVFNKIGINDKKENLCIVNPDSVLEKNFLKLVGEVKKSDY